MKIIKLKQTCEDYEIQTKSEDQKYTKRCKDHETKIWRLKITSKGLKNKNK